MYSMNRKHLNRILLAIVILTLGGWCARAAYRARRDLVSLDVRNAPLAEVIRSIERQTWERVVAEASLSIPVTLSVRNMPLSEVLDLLAEQTGALWRTTHAVYHSRGSLQALATSLLNTGKPGASWTNLVAPALPALDAMVPPVEDVEIERDDAQAVIQEGPNDTGPKPRRRVFRGGDVPGHPPGGPGGPPHPDAFAGAARAGVIINDGTGPHTIDISPERLLLEKLILPKMGQGGKVAVNAEGARALAKRLHAKYALLYTLEKLPVAGMANEFKRMTKRDPVHRRGGPDRPPHPQDLGSKLEADARAHRYERLARLTPEQRARQQQQSGGRMEIRRLEDVDDRNATWNTKPE